MHEEVESFRILLQETRDLAKQNHQTLNGSNGHGGLQEEVAEMVKQQVLMGKHLEVLLQDRTAKLPWRSQVIAAGALLVSLSAVVVTTLK
jgi:hypothetical protein|tara:strand:- start:1039 stop:1308 length:270 start_codon:yes stop_codon:yes gene_type:complete